MEDINDTSIDLINLLDLNSYNYNIPVSSKPVVDNDDYESVYINRYFFSNINYTNTKEIDVNSYNRINGDFFKKLNVQWKISGPRTNVYENNILKFEGVLDFNLKQIKKLKNTFIDIENVLKNPLEYWRGY